MDQATKLYIPALRPVYERLAPLSYPLIRVFGGAMLMPHGAQKLFEWFGGNRTNMAGLFSRLGLEPALPLVYFVGAIEFFGGFLIAIGLLTRPFAFLAFCSMVTALYTNHLPRGFFVTGNSNGLEFTLLWSVVLLAITLRGGGRYSVDHWRKREF